MRYIQLGLTYHHDLKSFEQTRTGDQQSDSIPPLKVFIYLENLHCYTVQYSVHCRFSYISGEPVLFYTLYNVHCGCFSTCGTMTLYTAGTSLPVVLSLCTLQVLPYLENLHFPSPPDTGTGGRTSPGEDAHSHTVTEHQLR